MYATHVRVFININDVCLSIYDQIALALELTSIDCK